MERLLAARSRHGWTSVKMKGAPCSLLLCCQHDLFHTRALSFRLLPALARLHRVSKGCSGAQPAQSCPQLHITAYALPWEGALRQTALEIETQDAFLYWRQLSCKRWWGWLLLFAWVEALYAAETCSILIYLLKSFFLLASRLMWWIISLVECWQVLCLVEEERCRSVTLPKGAGEH